MKVTCVLLLFAFCLHARAEEYVLFKKSIPQFGKRYVMANFQIDIESESASVELKVRKRKRLGKTYYTSYERVLVFVPELVLEDRKLIFSAEDKVIDCGRVVTTKLLGFNRLKKSKNCHLKLEREGGEILVVLSTPDHHQ